MAHDELACTYAALILADDKIAITGDKIAALTKAAGVTVQNYWPDLFASALAKKDINDLLLSASSGSAAPAAAPAAGAPAAAAKGGAAPAAKAPVKEEPKEEEAAMSFDLFD